MAKATRKNITKPSPKSASPKRSEIIKQSVIYLQSVAAFNAGFDADHGNCDIAGADGQLGNAALDAADRALHKLTKFGKLSAPEMKAKAAVFRAMMTFESGNILKEDRRDFLATFAIEVEYYFRDEKHSVAGSPAIKFDSPHQTKARRSRRLAQSTKAAGETRRLFLAST
jgi:hypothetical protein